MGPGRRRPVRRRDRRDRARDVPGHAARVRRPAGDRQGRRSRRPPRADRARQPGADGEHRRSPDPPQPGAPATLTAKADDPDGSVDKLAWDLTTMASSTTARATPSPGPSPRAGPHRVMLAGDGQQRQRDGDRARAERRRARRARRGRRRAPRAASRSCVRSPSCASPGGLPAAAPTSGSSPCRRRAARASSCAAAARAARASGSSPRRGGEKAKRLKRFQRSYRAGARLEIRVTSTPPAIGKFTRIRIRQGAGRPASTAASCRGAAKPRSARAEPAAGSGH